MQVEQCDETEDSNVFSFISDLRQEALFISFEKDALCELNDAIRLKTNELLQSTWVSTKKRLLVSQQKRGRYVQENLQEIINLSSTEFVEAKIALGYQNAIKIGTLLQIFRTHPKELAQWLIIGERINPEEHEFYSTILQSIVSGLYSSLVFGDDVSYMLVLLHELAKLQLCRSEKPQRVLKQGNNLFSSLYSMFHEVLLSANYYLSAALEVPILRLITTDFYLDIDPDKTVMRFQQEENINTIFKDAIEYRNEVVRRLAEYANLFVTSLQENILCFPKSLSWLIYRISKFINESFGDKEAIAVVTELIFTMFICPVIVNPEQYGIFDSQITKIARHNLIQIGQILQNLALIKYETADVKLMDLYSSINKNMVLNFLDELLLKMENTNAPPVDIAPFVFRDIALFTENELHTFIFFIKRVHNEIIRDEKPAFNESLVEHLTNLNLSPTENAIKRNRPTNRYESRSIMNLNGSPENPINSLKRSLTLGARVNTTPIVKQPAQKVLVFPIRSDVAQLVGMVPEDKIINMNLIAPKDIFIPIEHEPKNEIIIPKSAPIEVVKTVSGSFGGYLDEGSIGNTSDNLEAISEAASNHSVASSLELEENEDQNDNYSDMVSANVSGRGTPNISGRDTPSSQVIENEDRAPEVRQADIAQPHPQLSRQIRSEIDDKFCKFEIKKLPEGDETISLISETWSTDVLASDNETIDAGESRQDRHNLIEQVISEVPIGNILDISETQSESAWSTDVMTSDTERLTEVDNDDAGSIAQSDDTRSETDENMTPGSRRSSAFGGAPVSFSNVSNYQEYRKIEIKNDQSVNIKIQQTEKSTRKDSNANNLIFKSVTLTDSHQDGIMFSKRSSEVQSFNTTSGVLVNSLVSEQKMSQPTIGPDSKEQPGPSGMNLNHNKRGNMAENTPLSFLQQQNEILLSNCSLNSSSSGSSSNSFENTKPTNETSEKWDSKQWINTSQNSLNVTSTPSESTSELSVLSVSNIINPANILSINKKSGLGRNSKPSSSTGAIPKSISFDSTAEKNQLNDEDHRSKRGSFFGKLRTGFRMRRGKSYRAQDDMRVEAEDLGEYGRGKKETTPVKLVNNIGDLSSEDILAKYRTKPLEISPIKTTDTKPNRVRQISESTVPTNEVYNTFTDIKLKLRIVLSNTTAQLPGYIKIPGMPIRSKIDSVLRLELGKARKLKQWSNVARISEALKCINLLSENSCCKLFQSMREDIGKRTLYIQYLISSKKELLLSESYLDGLRDQVASEMQQYEEYLATICVNEFLTEYEQDIEQFCLDFKQLHLSDEKCDFLNNFLEKLYNNIAAHLVWQDIFEEQTDTVKIALQRCIISKVYENALYPNGDGDRDRDRVLFEHIEKLSRVITPDHKYLLIQKVFLREYPWLPAQDALKAMSAYRTPRDKLYCVVHCAKCIMDLLSLAQIGCATADDFTPVLVYVIIKSNPLDLMSTIEFVNSFYSNQLCGEEQYWWTQFCAAVEFIKTMDYSD